MIVVKLGGSLLGSPELQHWLVTIASNSDGHVIIVPGGGLYADAVRQAQQISGFDDAAAHRLAVMAMDQYGHTLAALEPKLVTASSELELAERSWQHRGIVWLPSSMVLADDTLPTSWDITSDSLAAWFAGRIQAKHLILVKSADNVAHLTPQQLAEQGLVDPVFPQFAARSNCPVVCLNKSDITRFSAILKGDGQLLD